MGHEELWKVKAERDRIYSLPEMTEEDGMAVAELETEFAEMDGYTAESRAGELLLGLGIGIEQHFGPMSEVSPGWKLRVWLVQELFSAPQAVGIAAGREIVCQYGLVQVGAVITKKN